MRKLDRYSDKINFMATSKLVKIFQLTSFVHITLPFYLYRIRIRRPFSIPGSELNGVIPSRRMVRWYNSHPHYDLHPCDLQKSSVGIVGVGNVSVDIARILLKSPDDLETSDISQRAINTLKKSKVNHVHMFARRSPVQAAFTAKI